MKTYIYKSPARELYDTADTGYCRIVRDSEITVTADIEAHPDKNPEDFQREFLTHKFGANHRIMWDFGQSSFWLCTLK